MKVEVPQDVASGAAKVGVGISRKAPIETTDAGVRYVEVEGVTARSVMRQWEAAHGVSYTDAGRLSGGGWGDGGDSDPEPEPDVDALTDEHWQTVATAVADGTLDDKLDELAEADSRPSVIEAIRERKAELV